MNKKYTLTALALAAAVITFLIYLPVLGNGFVNWDDPYYVYRNPNIRSLDIIWAYTAEVSSNWHPLTLISHSLDYALFGLNAKGHHLTNILLHAVNTFLIALLFFRLTMLGIKKENSSNQANSATLFALTASLVTALFFGIHPLRVESVAWISERKDLLYSLFYILSLIAYISYAMRAKKGEAGAKGFYAAALIIFMLSLMSKPMAISLPIVLIIIDIYPLERASLSELLNKKRMIVIEKAPFFLCSVLSAIVTLWAQAGSGAMSTLEGAPLLSRLLVSFRAYIFYIYKTVIPAKLAPIYPYSGGTDSMTGQFIGAIIIFIAISVISLYVLRKRKFLGALWLYYLVTLLPVIGIVHVGRQSAADRYTYLPGLAVIFLFGLAVAWLITRKKPWLTSITIIIIAALSILMGIKTVSQGAIWKDSHTLWSYEIKLYGDHSPAVAFKNRGLALQERGEFSAALGDFDKAIKIDPTHEGAYGNRGLAYQSIGRFALALKDYDMAILIDPEDKTAINNRGATYGQLGRYDEAIKNFERAIEIDPKLASAHNNLGKVYEMLGDRNKAILYYKLAASLGSAWAIDYLKREGIE